MLAPHPAMDGFVLAENRCAGSGIRWDGCAGLIFDLGHGSGPIGQRAVGLEDRRLCRLLERNEVEP